MKLLKTIFLLSTLALTACASTKIDNAALETVKNETFRVGTIKVPCKIQCLPSTAAFNTDDQIAALETINPQEILQVLSETYDLKFSTPSELVIDSYPIHFTGFISDSYGRCSYLENQSDASNENVVDIEYGLKETCIFLNFTGELSYDIHVKSGKKTVVRHVGEIRTIEYNNWLGAEDIKQFVEEAKNIAPALKKEIEITNKQKSQTN